MLDPVQLLEYETGLFAHIPNGRLNVHLSVHERRELQLACH